VAADSAAEETSARGPRAAALCQPGSWAGSETRAGGPGNLRRVASGFAAPDPGGFWEPAWDFCGRSGTGLDIPSLGRAMLVRSCSVLSRDVHEPVGYRWRAVLATSQIRELWTAIAPFSRIPLGQRRMLYRLPKPGGPSRRQVLARSAAGLGAVALSARASGCPAARPAPSPGDGTGQRQQSHRLRSVTGSLSSVNPEGNHRPTGAYSNAQDPGFRRLEAGGRSTCRTTGALSSRRCRPQAQQRHRLPPGRLAWYRKHFTLPCRSRKRISIELTRLPELRCLSQRAVAREPSVRLTGFSYD